MNITHRLRRLERVAERRERQRIERKMAHVNRLLAQAGPDCTRLFCIALARSIVDDNPGNLAALASLQESERWLAEREAAEPGFTNRVKSELRRLGLLKTGDVAMVRPAGIAST